MVGNGKKSPIFSIGSTSSFMVDVQVSCEFFLGERSRCKEPSHMPPLGEKEFWKIIIDSKVPTGIGDTLEFPSSLVLAMLMEFESWVG